MKLSPLIQLDAMDCGPTCLRMVAKFYGRSYSLQFLRELCHITREGVSLLGISDAAEAIGFRTTGVKITWKQLRDEMPFPCIVHWNQRHFVVVYGVAKRRKGIFVKVADPASGLLEYRAEDFLKSWLQTEGKTEGIALMLEPTPQFYQEEGEEKQKWVSTKIPAQRGNKREAQKIAQEIADKYG